jgi:hypothetical protein
MRARYRVAAMDLRQTLAALPLLVLRLRITPRDAALRLPAANKGNTLRGAARVQGGSKRAGCTAQVARGDPGKLCSVLRR